MSTLQKPSRPDMSAEFSAALQASETLAETIHASNRRAAVAAQRVQTQAAANPRASLTKRLAGGIVTLLVAGSLVLGSAAPSLADKAGDNLAKALAAALLIGTIANSIDNKNDRNRAEADWNRNHPRKGEYSRNRYGRVPANCAIEIDSNRGGVTVYTESCLRREGFGYRLPDCARSVRIYGKRDRVYSAQCLAEAGFRVNDRR